MKFITTLILLSCLSIAPARAEQDHPAKQLEAMLISCMPGGIRGDNCLAESLLKFTKNDQLRSKLPQVVDDLIDTILGDKKIYAVHPVITKSLGDYIREDSLMIETHDGAYALLEVTFLKTLGTWQVHYLSFASTKDKIQTKLGVGI